MKPRTKREKEVTALSATLPPLTEKQKAWAEKNAIRHIAFTMKSSAWCSDCGKTFTPTDEEKHCICPHCGRRLEVHHTRVRKYGVDTACCVFDTCGKYQVVRYFFVTHRSHKNEEKKFYLNEIVQHWIGEEGKVTIMACPGFYQSWLYYQPLTIKHREQGYYSRYDIWTDAVYPYGRVLPVLKRNGFRRGLLRYRWTTLPKMFKSLLTDNFTETLVKTHQYKLLAYSFNHNLTCYRHCVNICNRNNYIVEDAEMWADYLSLLDYLHLDTHNAFYVCHKELKKAHDTLMMRKRRHKEQEQRQVIEKEEEKYHRTKGRYFGICFGNERVSISVIASVRDMWQEGVAMHHCVYDAGYYKRGDSLILSARDRKGKRLETVEVNLKNLRVVQSRGVCNETTPYHEEIVELVNRNMGRIQKVRQQMIQ